jgi:hypothetical protein
MLHVEKNRILKNDKSFFYFADTCWSAFTNINMKDWRYYVNYRYNQGFNCIQINILKQWDSSGDDLNLYPFPIEKDGEERGAHFEFDYSIINEKYFDAAEEKLKVLQEYDMTPVLVLLWGNYVPGTWESKFTNNNLFPYENLEKYVAYVTKRFKKYNPIYFISGDTDFPEQQTIMYYKKAFEIAKENDPEALYTFHICGESKEVPPELEPMADIFTYQSGHFRPGQHFAYDIPQEKLLEGYTKPMINTEPCYEQIAAPGQIRFTRRDVRMAAWESVLSGASAGITYGAHGIWSWHHNGESFDSFIRKGAGFSLPFDWHDALRFEGANDLYFLKDTFEMLFPNGCTSDLVILNEMPEIRCAHDDEKFVIYLPTNVELNLEPLGINSENYEAKVIDLQNKSIFYPTWKPNGTQLNILPCYEDLLVVVKRK